MGALECAVALLMSRPVCLPRPQTLGRRPCVASLTEGRERLAPRPVPHPLCLRCAVVRRRGPSGLRVPGGWSGVCGSLDSPHEP